MDDALALNWLCHLLWGDDVLILVVMDDALARSALDRKGPNGPVLILVVMDDALARVDGYMSRYILES